MELGGLLKLIETGGPLVPALLLGYMWHQERKDRMALQESRDQLLERVLGAMNQSSSILAEWRRMLGG